MHKLFSIILLFLCPLFAHSQDVEKQYFDDIWKPCNQRKAAYYRIANPRDSLYEVKYYDMDDKLIVSGFVSIVGPDVTQNREGLITYYNADGRKTQEGFYSKGVQTGVWKTWFNGSDTVQDIRTYETGGTVQEVCYERETGLISDEFTYVNGTYMTKYKKYNKGILTHEKTGDNRYIRYYSDGSINREEKYGQNGNVYTRCYTPDGKPCTCADKYCLYDSADKMPSPDFNLQDYLAQNLHYPERARLKNKEGRVLVQFYVLENGSIEEATIVKGVSKDIDEEALRVITTMPRWKPGTRNGKPVKVYYTQPLMFKLE